MARGDGSSPVLSKGNRLSDAVADTDVSPPARQWARPALVAVLVLGLLSGVVAVGYWWTHPQALTSQFLDGAAYRGPGEETYMALADVAPLADGEVLRFSEVRIDRGAVTIDGRDVDLDRQLRADVIVCVDDPNEPLSLGGGASALELREYCSDVRPLLPGGRLDGRDQAESLLLRLSAEGRGLFELDGVSLDYRRAGFLGQRGTQRISVNFTLNTRDRMPN